MKSEQESPPPNAWLLCIMTLIFAVTVPPGGELVAKGKGRGKAKRNAGPNELVLPQASSVPAAVIPASAVEPVQDSLDLVLVTRVYAVEEMLRRAAAETGGNDEESRQFLTSWLLSIVGKQNAGWALRGAGVKSDAGVIGVIAADDNFRLAWNGNQMFVACDAHTQERIAAALRLIREHGFRQVAVEIRIVSGPADELAKLHSHWLPLDAAGPIDCQRGSATTTVNIPEPLAQPAFDEAAPTWSRATMVVERQMPQSVATLSHKEMGSLINRIQNNPRMNLIFAPKVTLFNGQAATIQDTVQRPFVVGFKRPSSSDTTAAHEPNVRVVTEGTTIHVRPVLRDNSRVRLDCELTLASIRDVETANVPQGPGKNPLAVQVPEVATIRIDTSVDAKLDDTLLIGGLQQQDRQGKAQGMLVMLTAREVATEPKQAARADSNGTVPSPLYLRDDVQFFPAGPTTRLNSSDLQASKVQSTILTVTPRTIIQEEEEALLGIDVEEAAK